jgi:phage shock protein E
MKKYILILIAMFSMGTIAFSQTANHKQVVVNLSTMRFKFIIGNDKNGGLLDLRTTDEINNGYIKGSVQLDFSAKGATSQIDKLDKTKVYYLYCDSGAKSAEAAAYMENHDFKQVYVLQKGFADWVKQGYPVEKK